MRTACSILAIWGLCALCNPGAAQDGLPALQYLGHEDLGTGLYAHSYELTYEYVDPGQGVPNPSDFPIYDVEGSYTYLHGWVYVVRPHPWDYAVQIEPRWWMLSTGSAPCVVEQTVGPITIYAATPVVGPANIVFTTLGPGDVGHVPFWHGTALLPVTGVGDLDGDFDVDLADLATLLASYGTTSGAIYDDGDLDGDGDVDLADLAALLAVYGTNRPGWLYFYDGFDTYPPGGGVHGLGGWKGWDGDLAFDARISAEFALSQPKSVDISGATDLVHEFSGADSGRWIFSTWQYVPSSFSGESYFILLNTYSDGGPYNWSVQVKFSSDGTVESEFDGGQLPLVTDRWVGLRVEIDLDADTQSIYYDDNLLVTKSWTEGVTGSGAANIAAVDLYANGATSVYYDDVSIRAMSRP